MYRHGIRKGAPAAVAVAADTAPLSRGLKRSTSVWFVVALLAVAALAFALPAHSATYYVATTGNDNNSGTSSTPWRNINYAVPQLQPGDVLIIKDGTYYESVDLDRLVKANPAITIQAQNPRKAIIDAQNATIGIGAWQPVEGIRLIGLKVINGKMGVCFYRGGTGMDVINCEITGGIEGIRIPDGSNLKIQDCYVHDNNQGVLLGVKDSSGVSNILIERVVAADNSYDGTGNTDGFAVEGMCTNLVIRDCVSYGAGDSGFDIKPSDAILERVLSYNNANMGIKLWGSRVKVINAIVYGNKIDGIATAGDNLQFWNCTIANNAENGIRLETQNVTSVTLRNNIFYNNPVYTYSSNTWNDDYNCYYSTSSSDYVMRTASNTWTTSQVESHSAPVGSHSRGHNPNFESPGTANFRLASNSPCIGAGLASSLVAVDYYGTTRNNPPDKGAIAASGSTTIVPTAPTTVSITPSGTVGTDVDLKAQAAGSTVSNGATITYQYQWAMSTNNGSTWGTWGNTGSTLAKSNLANGQMWKARARATVDNTNYSAWTESSPVTVGTTSTPTLPAPTAVTVSPAQPGDDDNLVVTATGGGAAGTTPTYQYEWSKSTDGGTNWSAWGSSGSTILGSATQPGEKYKARARVVSGSEVSDYTYSNPVTIGSATTNPLLPPREVTITPTEPQDADELQANPRGGGNGDMTDTYQYQWAKSTNNGSTWGSWVTGNSRQSASNTTPGDMWKVRVRVNHQDIEFSDWTESPAVTIAGGTTTPATPTAPTSVTITPIKPTAGQTMTANVTPTAPAGITYHYQWRLRPAGSTIWGKWITGTATMVAAKAGERYQARVRATNGSTYSTFTKSKVAVVQAASTAPTSNVAPEAPTVTITPDKPYDGSTLTASAVATDANGDNLEYEFYWARSTDGGASWSGWNWYGKTIAASETQVGDKWKAYARAHDGKVWGKAGYSLPVTVR